MYQENNKNSIRVLGIREPSGVKITALNEQSNWALVFSDTKSAARGSYLRSINPDREIAEYSDPDALSVTVAEQFLSFGTLNDVSITPIDVLVFRVMGLQQLSCRILFSGSPSTTGTIIAQLQFLDGTWKNIDRTQVQHISTDTAFPSIKLSGPHVSLGPTESYRVRLTRSGGQDTAITMADTTLTINKV